MSVIPVLSRFWKSSAKIDKDSKHGLIVFSFAIDIAYWYSFRIKRTLKVHLSNNKGRLSDIYDKTCNNLLTLVIIQRWFLSEYEEIFKDLSDPGLYPITTQVCIGLKQQAESSRWHILFNTRENIVNHTVQCTFRSLNATPIICHQTQTHRFQPIGKNNGGTFSPPEHIVLSAQ